MKTFSLNDKLGLGRLENGRRRFTSHMLRKFQSTTLWNEKVSKEVIDALQGRGKDQTHASYFYENPLKLREIYIENMQYLCINWDVANVDIKSPEYMELEKENNELRDNYSKLWDEINSVKARQDAWEELKNM